MTSSAQPNVIIVLADQLRAQSLPLYGEPNIQTPHLDALARGGMVLDNMIASCPVCTPSRAMLLTGRHPQTTGHIINSTRTRHGEISLADCFGRHGYRTGWVGKWHLHTGAFPAENQPDFVPQGRDRLGFDYWRGYNMHMKYFGGWVNRGDWECEAWEGYETQALNRYGFEFIDQAGGEPFLLCLSPHQPHWTPYEFAPQSYYDRLPERLALPANVSANPDWDYSPEQIYRHYLAMTLALDDMIGELTEGLRRRGLEQNTLVLFTSDHGTQAGSQGIHPWEKRHPYEASLRVPLIVRWPGGELEPGRRTGCLTAMPDLFPTLCGLCGLPVPRTVEGHDLSGAWLGRPGAFEQPAVLTMNFSSRYDWFAGGLEWRGVRTRTHSYTRWLDGRTELFDLTADPLQVCNLAGEPSAAALESELAAQLDILLQQRGDRLQPCDAYRSWQDEQRRVIRNAYGPLGHPEDPPDWSLLNAVGGGPL